MNIYKNNVSILIRDIKKKDANELFNLLNGLDKKTKKIFHPHPFDIETISNICKLKKDHYFVMFLENEMIGYSFLRLFGYNIPSFGIIIKKEFSDKGFGTILIDWTINKAKELGYKKVILKTYKENIAAQKIYEKIGFKITGETEDNKQYKMDINL